MSLNFTIHATDGDHKMVFEDFDAVVKQVGSNVAKGEVSNDGVVYGITADNEAAQNALNKHQSMGNSKIHNAKNIISWMESGHADRVNEMLEKYPYEIDLNHPDLLTTAVGAGLENVATNLMNIGVKPNSRELMHIVYKMSELGQHKAIQMLIEMDDQQDLVKRYALEFAANCNDMSLVQSMIKQKTAMYDQDGPKTNSALYRAIDNKNMDIAYLLLNSMPDVEHDRLSFGLACRMGESSIPAKMIQIGFDIQEHKQALIDESMRFDNSIGLATLQEYGIDYSDQFTSMATLAISGGKMNIIEKLVNEGVSFEHIEQDTVERGLAKSRNPEQFQDLVNRIGINTDDMHSKLPKLNKF